MIGGVRCYWTGCTAAGRFICEARAVLMKLDCAGLGTGNCHTMAGGQTRNPGTAWRRAGLSGNTAGPVLRPPPDLARGGEEAGQVAQHSSYPRQLPEPAGDVCGMGSRTGAPPHSTPHRSVANIDTTPELGSGRGDSLSLQCWTEDTPCKQVSPLQHSSWVREDPAFSAGCAVHCIRYQDLVAGGSCPPPCPPRRNEN